MKSSSAKILESMCSSQQRSGVLEQARNRQGRTLPCFVDAGLPPPGTQKRGLRGPRGSAPEASKDRPLGPGEAPFASKLGARQDVKSFFSNSFFPWVCFSYPRAPSAAKDHCEPSTPRFLKPTAPLLQLNAHTHDS